MKLLKSLICGLAVTAAVNAAAADTPKYIFYFIGDGMGHGQVMAADTYRRLVEKQQDKLLMLQFPVAGLCTTYSANSPVTDSAAAGTALATGSKTRNNMLGMNADTVAVQSVAIDLADQGYGIGLVTNVCPDDATPGAFYAHVPARWMWHDIALQFADSPVKFLAGSKLRGAMQKGKYTGLYEKIRAKGVEIARGVENLPADADRVILLNTDTISENMGYAVDSPKGNTLAQFTDAAIAHLQRTSPDKFFLMVEGGNIDWAGHDNDGITIVREVLSYNDVLQQAYRFYLDHPDETLIVVTADHETGGMTVGQRSTGYNQYPQVVDRQHKSKAQFSRECWNIINSNDSTISWDQMKARLEADLGFFTESKLSDSQTERLLQAFERTFIAKDGKSTTGLYSTYPEFAEVVYTIQNELAGYGFTSGKHTGNPVPVFAIGVGAEQFGGSLDNTQIPRIIRRLTGCPSN